MKINVVRREGYELLHEGSIALSVVEDNGIRIDLPKLAKTQEQVGEEAAKLKKQLQSGELWKVFRRRFGENANMISREQLGKVLFDEMGFKPLELTRTKRPKVNETLLQTIDHPDVKILMRILKYDKAIGTFLKGIQKEVVGDRLHPVFNLHTVLTYRSSSDNPNFQNLPVRDKEISRIVRSVFIPSPNHVLVENDFKAIEVSVSACYHHDKNFISYIMTPGKDMHRDMAAQIYMLEPEEVSKEARYGAKNKFVFPQFYGDYYVACAKNLWEWITKGRLTGPGGIPLMEHLKKRGISRLGACDPDEDPTKGTFEHHLKEVEDDFWNRRFMAYGKWRRDFYQSYLEKGYFDLHTGFRVHGAFRRNAVTNYPVQGSAFHCLLWTIIQVNKALRKYKMRSIVAGQIHDSLIADVHEKELADYFAIVEETATVRLRQHFDWLIVPLGIEYEICPLGGNWFQKREVKFDKGVFTHPTDPTKTTKDPLRFLAALKE